MNMKMNKWTMALAAAGVVSLSSVAQAQEAAAGVNALAASTTLSGYVSTSYTISDTTADTDSFKLDVVDIKMSSAQGAGEYATGYTVELWVGPGAEDSTGYFSPGTSGSDGTVELMQANIDLRLPWGNGLDLKVGQFYTVVGAETHNYNENAFYTRSYGFAIEPTHHTGVLASYQITDDANLKVGFVNDTSSAQVNSDRGGTAYLVALDYTLPESVGFLGGTELTYARVEGANMAAGGETDNQYIGASIPLPVEGLTYKVAWDIAEYDGSADSNVVAHYLSYAVSDKTTLNVRYETGNINVTGNNIDGIKAWTVGLDYKLWENVISRVEYRSADADSVNGVSGDSDDSATLNIIYSF
jgi:hypothetical protein